MDYVMAFIVGVFACNCIPHIVSGLRGDPFPTPFAKPPGQGNSPPAVNFLWGSANLLVAVALAVYAGPALFAFPVILALGAGWLLAGLPLASHFGKVRGR